MNISAKSDPATNPTHAPREKLNNKNQNPTAKISRAGKRYFSVCSP